MTVTGVAIVKVMTDKELLKTACEQFLGKRPHDIERVVLQTLEGHLRAILGTLTVEEIYKDREAFALRVREIASPDVGHMGIEILSFTIKDIKDKVNYLNALGRTQIATVKKNADVGVAEANRDAGVKESDCERTRLVKQYSTNTSTYNAQRDYFMKKAEFDREVNAKRAEAEHAYALEAAKQKQSIREEEIRIQVIERMKMIEIEEREIDRREKELQATIKSPADAESYKLQTLAEAARTRKVFAAEADAARIMMVGAAEAAAIEAVGKAEAERMRQKATAYKEYGDAALMSLILEAMPKIAAEISAPLGKTNEIVILNEGNGVGGEMTKLIATLPPAVHALTGVNLTKCLGKVPGAMIA